MCSPTRPHPGGGGETCAETGINIFFIKVLDILKLDIGYIIDLAKVFEGICLPFFSFHLVGELWSEGGRNGLPRDGVY